ncbi:iron chaperone [Agromyces sp. NPDC058126]|uniref:iron chaperone n=1 Tax=Agromyces sp. NPDC058126 TaxID=3346350 RepID=UPI0036D79E30
MATKTDGLSTEERAAVKQRAAELRAQAKAGKNREAGEKAIREAIAEMPDEDRELAEGIDRIVKEVAPHLMPKTWYGFPAYTDADGKVVVFFKAASKFTTRYATLGFEEAANLDDGDLWATSFALLKWTPEVEARIAEVIRKAGSDR